MARGAGVPMTAYTKQRVVGVLPSQAPGKRVPPTDERPLVDRNGHRHSAAVLTTWSPQLLKIMDIRSVERERED